ncbi:MAG: hypothetical protein EAZ55_01490 [Cytophagales bacterium]|nr:MAG: hypothetical protein EAZ55_01490 [Cytophagales bacterium]
MHQKITYTLLTFLMCIFYVPMSQSCYSPDFMGTDYYLKYSFFLPSEKAIRDYSPIQFVHIQKTYGYGYEDAERAMLYASYYYNNKYGQRNYDYQTNLSEWTTYTKNQTDEKDIQDAIYDFTEVDWEKIYQSVQNPKNKILSPYIESNTFVQYLLNTQDKAAIEYLYQSKIIEPSNERGNVEWLEEATKDFKPTTTDFKVEKEEGYSWERLDNLGKISTFYDCKVSDILRLNPQLDTITTQENYLFTSLPVGTTLKIPVFVKTITIEKEEKLSELIKSHISLFLQDNPQTIDKKFRVWNNLPSRVKSYFLFGEDKDEEDILLKPQQYNIYIGSATFISKTIINQLENKLKTENNTWLKLRYAFQCMRLYNYGQMPEKSIAIYDNEVTKLPQVNSIAQYWALERKADALTQINRRGEANRLYAIVFDRVPEKRADLLKNIRYESDADFENTLKACENSREKCLMYFIRALAPFSQPIEEMKNIYQIDNKSEFIEMLILREINRIEQFALGVKKEENLLFMTNVKELPKNETLKKIDELREWLIILRNQNKVNNGDFIQIALAYLDYLAGFKAEGKQALQKMIEGSKKADLVKQAKILQIVIEIVELNTYSPELENQLFQRIKALELKNTLLGVNPNDLTVPASLEEQLLSFLSATLQPYYNSSKKPEEKAKFTLSNPQFSIYVDFMLDLQADRAQSMVALFEKPNKNDYEYYLLSKIDAVEELQKVKIYEYLGTTLLRDGRAQEALIAFEKIPNPKKYLRKYEDEIFQVKRMPLPFTLEETYNLKSFTKIEVARWYIDLETKIKKDPKNAEKWGLLLGNLQYNIGVRGKASTLTAYFHTARTEYDYTAGKLIGSGLCQDCILSLSIEPNGILKYKNQSMGLEVAQNTYQNALKIAKKKKNREIAAALALMLAECEQRLAYCKDKEFSFEPAYSIYYQQIKDQYQNTQYIQEALKECYYLDSFLNL